MIARLPGVVRPLRWGCALALVCLGCSDPSVNADATGGSSSDAGTGGDSSASGGDSSTATGGTTTGGASGTGGASSGGAPGAGGASSGGAGGTGGAGGSGGGPPGFRPCPLNGPCAILPLGDSITEGYGSTGGGYRVELFRLASQAGADITFVGSGQNGPANNLTFPKHHEGHGGFTIDSGTGHSGISGAITQSAITNYHPHIVLLMIGTNDVNGNIDVDNAPARLGNLVDDITTRAPDALLVLATIMPINSGANTKVTTYNTSVKALAADRVAQGKHVLLVDNYAVVASTNNWQNTLLNDYLHPNNAGYALLGASFYGAVETFLR